VHLVHIPRNDAAVGWRELISFAGIQDEAVYAEF
jgi:hypothetical protein